MTNPMPKNTKQSARGKKGIKAWAVYDGILEKIVVKGVDNEFAIYEQENMADYAKHKFIFANNGQYEIRRVIPVLITPIPTPRRKGRVSKK